MREENASLKVEIQVLRATSPFQPVWLPPSQSPPPPAYTPAPITTWHIDQQTLRLLLEPADMDLADIWFINDRKEQLSESQRPQAEQVIGSIDFHDWIVSPFPAKLLVQWDYHGRRPRTVAGVSPLSVFCTTMAQALRANSNNNDRFLSVLWFCGRHLDRAGAAGPRESGHAMLVSLLDQLLRAHEFDMWALCRDTDPEDLYEGNHDAALVGLLVCLVRQLPATTTLFFIVDGVSVLEREEVSGDGLGVLSSLLALTHDRSLQATVKVMFTSTPGTEVVREGFEDGSIIEVGALSRLGLPASEERVARELGVELGGGACWVG